MSGEITPQQPENMPPHLSGRDQFNLALIAQDRENTNRFAERLIDRTVHLIGEYLMVDATHKATLDAQLAAGEKTAVMEQYIVPDALTYPMPDNRTFQGSLSMLLQAPSEDVLSRAERAIFGDSPMVTNEAERALPVSADVDADGDRGDTEDARLTIFDAPEVSYRTGDRLRLSIPVPEKYRYPESLDPADIPPAAEPEMMLEFIPAGVVLNSVRFLIRPNELTQTNDDEVNFEVVRYVSAYDAGTQHIEGDELTAKMVYDGLTRRMPKSGQLMRRFVELAAEFDIVPQRLTSTEGSIEL